MTTRTLLKSIVAAIAITFALGASTALADSAATDSKAKKPKVKTLIFGDGSDVEGGVVRPDGDSVSVIGKLQHSNLIKVREHFIPEIFKSAEDL